MENPENGANGKEQQPETVTVVIQHEPATGRLNIQAQVGPTFVMGILRDALILLEENRKEGIRLARIAEKAQSRHKILTPDMLVPRHG